MKEFTCFYQTGEHLDGGKEIESECQCDGQGERFEHVGGNVSNDTGDAGKHKDGDHGHGLTGGHQVGLSPEQLNNGCEDS